MTIELGQRLLRGGLLTPAEIESALHEAVERGLALVHVISERWPDQARRLERELERVAPASIAKVRAAPELAARLPTGMCERLLAVPLVPEAPSRFIDVACADALDAHVLAEFAFHLQAEVRTLHAPHSEISDAIDGLHAGGTFLGGVSRMLEAPPIGGAHSAVPPHTATSPSERAGPPGSEPPIPLVRRSLLPKTPERAVPPAAPPLEAPRPPDVAPLIEAMQRAASSDEIFDAVVRGLAAVGERVLLFAVKATQFEGKLAHGPGLDSATLRRVTIPADAPSILRTAGQSGQYLGRLPATDAHAKLSELLQAGGREVYAVRLSISGRAAVIAVVTGFETAFTASQLADELVAAASRALERVMRDKKSRRA